jgi:hypothetical protein
MQQNRPETAAGIAAPAGFLFEISGLKATDLELGM